MVLWQDFSEEGGRTWVVPPSGAFLPRASPSLQAMSQQQGLVKVEVSLSLQPLL